MLVDIKVISDEQVFVPGGFGHLPVGSQNSARRLMQLSAADGEIKRRRMSPSGVRMGEVVGVVYEIRWLPPAETFKRTLSGLDRAEADSRPAV